MGVAGGRLNRKAAGPQGWHERRGGQGGALLPLTSPSPHRCSCSWPCACSPHHALSGEGVSSYYGLDLCLLPLNLVSFYYFVNLGGFCMFMKVLLADWPCRRREVRPSVCGELRKSVLPGVPPI